MQRRTFLQMAASVPAFARESSSPAYRIVSSHAAADVPGMPGRYPGRAVRVHGEKSIDEKTDAIDAAVAREMLSRGICGLTGAKQARDGWASFISPKDVVGIKVNCSGAPGIMSSPEVVGGIVASLTSIGVPAKQIYIYERFPDQLISVHYERHVPKEVNIVAVEQSRGSIIGYDPNTYVDVDFFGEDDTRSNLIRLVSERFTKIINVPNMKDHQAAGVTGCLKNIAYGDFSNVARSHYHEKTNTLTFIGTLASVEPLRSRTVLQVMDGLRGIWHGGPFAVSPRYRFYPKQIVFGTDPVALDRLLLDVIDAKRKAEGAISVQDRSRDHLGKDGFEDPNVNHFIREPGHIEYAGKLGLGVYDKGKINVTAIEV